MLILILSKTLYPLLSTDSTRIKTGNHTNMTEKLCEEYQLVHIYSNVVITSNLAAMVNVLKNVFFHLFPRQFSRLLLQSFSQVRIFPVFF